MGDSPILLVDNTTGAVTKLYTDHNWENIEEYQEYVTHCLAANQKPSQPMYGRWNSPGQPEIPNQEGDYQPIPIYDINNGKVSIHETNLTHITELTCDWGYTGGTQTCRQMVTLDNYGTKVAPYPGYGHLNWGSSILATADSTEPTDSLCRCTRGWGDWAEQMYANTFGSNPSIRLLELPPNQDVSVIIMSDGVGDLWYFHKLGEYIQKLISDNNALTGKEISQMVLLQTIRMANAKPEYTVKNGCPEWDDTSLVVARWTQNNDDILLDVSPEYTVPSVDSSKTENYLEVEESPIVAPASTESLDDIKDMVHEFVNDIIQRAVEKSTQLSSESPTRITISEPEEKVIPCTIFASARPPTPTTMPNLPLVSYADKDNLLAELHTHQEVATAIFEELVNYHRDGYTQVVVPIELHQSSLTIAGRLLLHHGVEFTLVTKGVNRYIYFNQPPQMDRVRYCKLATLSGGSLVPDIYSETSSDYDSPQGCLIISSTDGSELKSSRPLLMDYGISDSDLSDTSSEISLNSEEKLPILPKDELPKDELPKDELPKDELPKDGLPRDIFPYDESYSVDSGTSVDTVGETLVSGVSRRQRLAALGRTLLYQGYE
jgi:serine/threonine protein phosphatase PrpC